MNNASNNSRLNAYSTGLLQGIAYNRLHARLTRALLPYNLSIPEWKLLGQLHEFGEINLSKLASLLSYDPPMVTKIVKSLEKTSLVKRTQDKKDERVKLITITEKGHKLIEDTEPVIKKTMHEILAGVSQSELTTYLKVLTVIVNNTDE